MRDLFSHFCILFFLIRFVVLIETCVSVTNVVYHSNLPVAAVRMKRSGAKEIALSLRRLFNCEIKVSRKLNLIQKYVPTCGDSVLTRDGVYQRP